MSRSEAKEFTKPNIISRNNSRPLPGQARNLRERFEAKCKHPSLDLNPEEPEESDSGSSEDEHAGARSHNKL